MEETEGRCTIKVVKIRDGEEREIDRLKKRGKEWQKERK